MTYEELPYPYREYSKTCGWTEDQALEYWRQGDKYREYAVSIALAYANDGMLNSEISGVELVRRVILSLRGERAWLT